MAIVCALVGIGMYIDPYGVFHYDAIPIHSGEPNSRYVKTKYILNHPTEFDSFLFGSSRVGYIHVHQRNDEQHRWYNMTYSNAGLAEVKDTIECFLEEGVKPKQIMIGIDTIDDSNPYVHDGDLLRTMYPRTWQRKIAFYPQYMNPAVGMEALLTLEFVKGREADSIREKYYTTGAIYKEGSGEFHSKEIQKEYQEPSLEMSKGIENDLEVLRRIVALCEDNQIQLILFSTPLHESVYLSEVERGYILYIAEIAKIHDIYHFSGLNTICCDDSNYWEEIHFKKEVGDEILKTIFEDGNQKEEDGDLREHDEDKTYFGMIIHKENAEQYIDQALEEIRDNPL